LNFQTSNSELNKVISNLPSAALFNSVANDNLPTGLSLWTEGSVSIGKVDATSSSSSQDTKSIGISIGVDQVMQNGGVIGLAYRKGRDEVEFGSSGSKLESNAHSLTLYGGTSFNENYFIEGLLGGGYLNYDITREGEFGTQTGNRIGKQLFSSVNMRGEFDVEGLGIAPYLRADAGYTRLSAYSESGAPLALSYERQSTINSMISTGLLADYSFDLANSSYIKPYGRLEYGRNLTRSSDADMSYVTVPSVTYTQTVNRVSNYHMRTGLGVETSFENVIFFKIDYERNQDIGAAYSNTFRGKIDIAITPSTKIDVATTTNLGLSQQATLGISSSPYSNISLNANLSASEPLSEPNGEANFSGNVSAKLKF